MKLKQLGVAAATLAAAAISIAAVSAWSAPGHVHSDSDYLFAHLQARSEAHDADWLESSMSELLPSHQFSVNGGPAVVRSSGVVIGRVTDVRAGKGFAHPDDAPSSTMVDFNAKDALWRTVEVTVAVDEAWGKVAGQPTVTFAVIIDRGINGAKAVNGLRGLGQVFVSLDRQGRYAYAPGLYSISHSGDLFGTVDAQGNIQLRAAEHGDDFMNGLTTVARLRAEAAKAPTVVKVNIVDGLGVRQ